MNRTTYGPGGYNPAAPDQNVVAVDTLAFTDDPRNFNRDDLTTKARAALAANATFLGLASPSNVQVLAQVQRLTRECSALIKLMLDDLADTTGT